MYKGFFEEFINYYLKAEIKVTCCDYGVMLYNRKNNNKYFFVSLQKKDMLTKANVIKTITRFPDNFSIDELVDKMILLEKIEKGIQDADKGRVISENELAKRIEEWLNK